MFPRRPRPRTLVLALAATLTIVYLLAPSGPPSSAPEPVRLAYHMNRHAPNPPLRKSTFDYGSISPLHPPPEAPTPVPQPDATPLPPIQHPFTTPLPPHFASRRRQIRDLFRKDWALYRKHAWARDALLPLSLSAKDQFSGWAATLVDSLDALYLLGLRREFDEAVAEVATLDFGEAAPGKLSTFETTIRYLGGLLSAYELSGRGVLLEKAVELGDLLYAAFDTPERMPVSWLNLQKVKGREALKAEGMVESACPGSLSLEMTRLSQITGDARYYDAVTRVMRLFASGQNDTAMPGMWPLYVSLRQGDVTRGSTFTLGAGADSLYEYLPKMHLLLGGGEPMYADMTRGFLDASGALLFRPMLPEGVDEDILVAGVADVVAGGDGEREVALVPETEHLACFAGGAVALAGRMLGDEGAVETGARLARGCAYLYRAVPSGIMPERLTLVPCPVPSPSSPSSATPPTSCPWNQTLYEEHKAKRQRDWRDGTPQPFTSVSDPRYLLRPEALESLFVLYRLTGDEAFADAAWEMFLAIREGVSGGGAEEDGGTWWGGKGGSASAAVVNVLGKGELEREDYMEVSTPFPPLDMSLISVSSASRYRPQTHPNLPTPLPSCQRPRSDLHKKRGQPLTKNRASGSQRPSNTST